MHYQRKKINQGHFLACPGSAEYKKKKQYLFRVRLNLIGIFPHFAQNNMKAIEWMRETCTKSSSNPFDCSK